MKIFNFDKLQIQQFRGPAIIYRSSIHDRKQIRYGPVSEEWARMSKNVHLCYLGGTCRPPISMLRLKNSL